jgi:DNA-binding transcriptional LysR family regulator
VVLPWEQLRLVLALSRHGSLAGAARALGMSPAALEGELTRVERAAGASLFVREEGRLFPTDAGRSAMRTGERMSEEMARVERALPRIAPGAPVRLRMDELLAAQWLPAAAADLTRKLGNVGLELVGARGRGGTADLEVTTARPASAHREAPRALGVLAEALYGSEAYLLDHGRPSRHDRLVGHRVVLLSGPPARTAAGRWLTAAARSGAQVALRTDSVPVFVSAVHSGLGLGVLPGGSEELAPELVPLFALPELPPRPVWLAFPGQGRPSARVKRAAQVLEQTLGAALRRWERAR